MAPDDPIDDSPADASADAGAEVPNDSREPARDTPPPKQRGFFRRHWLGIIVAILVILPVGGFFLWTTATLAYTYSSGERAGYNQKLSRRGWICKTWEGELAISAVPGVAPELFRYSVRSDSVAQAIQSHSGKFVTLYYEQHKGVPSSCFGESEYFVIGVKAT